MKKVKDKITTKKKATTKKKPVTQPVIKHLDIQALRLIHAELSSFISGGGTVESRQKVANKLLAAINGS